MLKQIILEDFESHKHTVIDNLSSGINLICGVSNSGKTSIVRALRLISYNEFDTGSVRVGCTKCMVTVKTDKGTVKVTRGPKHNLWEVTKNGQPTQYFDKIGTKVSPEVSEIIGLNMVTLGDVKVPVNIMDQLESHFMLAGVGDKDATGSMRAQIIDEISGLSGIETVIKAVSLDNTRLGRKVSETETEMEETRKQLHSERELARERSVLTTAEGALKEADEYTAAASESERLITEHNSVKKERQEINRKLASIPDIDTALAELDAASQNLEYTRLAQTILSENIATISDINTIMAKIKSLPDIDLAKDMMSEATDYIQKTGIMKELIEDGEGAVAKIKKIEGRIVWLEQADVGGTVTEAEESLRVMQEIEKYLQEVDLVDRGIMGLKKELDICEGKIRDAIQLRDDILSKVTVCPLTMKSVSQQCLEDAK